MIVTRFAPSPTGLLHVGHALAALTAFETARRAGGRFLLRIEDIDRARCRAEFEHAIFEDLAWLGIRWEEPVRRQSEHFADYAAALAGLNAMGIVYPCFCTRREIAEEIARAGVAPLESELGEVAYPGTCRGLDQEERARRLAAGSPHALRLDVGKALRITKPLAFEERGRGPLGETGMQAARPELTGDVVIARKDMQTSYHLAVVVDDALQGVNLVTRGEDLFGATHIQRLLQALLGLPPPAYAHHPLLLDERGRKFAKREKSATLAGLRAAGRTAAEVRAMVRL